MQLLEEKYIQVFNERLKREKRLRMMSTFVQYACEHLGISKPYPTITLNNHSKFASTSHTFGQFHVTDNKIVVATYDRNLADIMRSVAHELTHYWQKETGRIDYQNADASGKTGSDIENEANAKAGIIMREFGKKHPEIFD